MHHDRIRLPGGWTDLSVLHAAEMELFDASQVALIDGDTGGAWAPTSQIVIGGAGVWVTGPLIANDLRATVTSGHSIVINNGAVIDVRPGGVVQFGATGLLIGGANRLDGSRLILNPDSGLGGAQLVAGGPAFFGDTVDFQTGSAIRFRTGTVTTFFSGAGVVFQLGSTLTCGATSTFTADVSFTGSGGSYNVLFDVNTRAFFSATTAAKASIFAFTPRVSAGPVQTSPAATGPSDPALLVTAGHIRLAAPPPAATDVIDNNVLTQANIFRAVARIRTDGAGNVTLLDGLNVAEVTLVGSAPMNAKITFAVAMPTASYGVIFGADADVDEDVYPHCTSLNRHTDYVEVLVRNQGGGPTETLDLATFAVNLTVGVVGG